MALTGLQPFESANVFANTATGTAGRDPRVWGTTNDPSHGTLGAGDTVTPATGFQMAPGDEFAFGDIDAYLDEDQHGFILDTTPINPPGIGENVPLPLGYSHADDPRRWEAEALLTQAHSQDQGGPLRARHVNPPAQGTEDVAAWQMRATNRGSTYNDNGSLVSLPGSDRPAIDLSVHNRARMLKEPIVGYGERPWFNNVAAVTARSEAPRSILSPSNAYPVNVLNNPGPGVVYASPPDPQINAQTTSAEVPVGLEWM
jgi:hypothetical protein